MHDTNRSGFRDLAGPGDAPGPRLARRTGLLAAGAALLSGCSGTRVLDALVSDASYDLRGGTAYGDDPRQKLDVYVPRSVPTGTRPAVVVFFYGGSWTRGERADYRFVGEAMASAGVIAVVADYRLSPQVRWDAIARDGAAAVAWTMAHLEDWGADPRRVFVMGHSAGGWLAAMVALDGRWLAAHGLAPARLAGWIGLAGAYDFLPIGDPEVRVAFGWPDTPPASQPVTHVSTGAPRTLLIAPEADRVVDPVRNTEGLGARLRAAGVPVTVRRHPKVNHATLVGALAGPLRWLAPVRREVLDFIDPRTQPVA